MIVELMVALFVISTTMVLLVGTFLSAQKSYRANNTSADVAAELAFLLEDISREARVSGGYGVSGVCTTGANGPCTVELNRVADINSQGAAKVTYSFSSGGVIKQVEGSTPTSITSPNITVSRIFAAEYGGDTDSEPSRIFLSLTARPATPVLGAGDTTVQTTLTSRFD